MDDRWEPVKKELLEMNGQFVLCQPYPSDENLHKVVMLFRVRIMHGFVYLVNSKTGIPKYFDNFVKDYKDCAFYICMVGEMIGGESDGN